MEDITAEYIGELRSFWDKHQVKYGLSQDDLIQYTRTLHEIRILAGEILTLESRSSMRTEED